MNEKRKLILRFAVDCFYIVACSLTMIAHWVAPMLIGSLVIICFSLFYPKIFFPNKDKEIRFEDLCRLTPAEAIRYISLFLIGVSAICIFFFAEAKGLLNNMAFTIPMWLMLLAMRLHHFGKDWAALQTSRSVSN